MFQFKRSNERTQHIFKAKKRTKNGYREQLRRAKNHRLHISTKHRIKLTRKFYNIPNTHFVVKYSLLKLNKYFDDNNLKEMFKFIEKIRVRKVMDTTCLKFTKESKNMILDVYYYNMRLRSYVNKMIFLWKMRRRIRNIKPTNMLTLDLDPIGSIAPDNIVRVYCEKSKSFYIFHYKNIINTFRIILEGETSGFPDPGELTNPYTKIKFTLKQLISIFDRLNTILYNKKQKMPLILTLFSKSYNIKRFLFENKRFLCLKSCDRYIKDQTDDSFEEMLKLYIYDFFPNTLCFKCIKKKLKNYRKIFEPVIIKYMIDSNILYINHSMVHIKMVDELINSYNLGCVVNSCKHFLTTY